MGVCVCEAEPLEEFNLRNLSLLNWLRWAERPHKGSCWFQISHGARRDHINLTDEAEDL